MKINQFVFLCFLLVLGKSNLMAQSNPNSTNAVDVEMQLAWNDGVIYISGVNYADITTAYGGPGSTNTSFYGYNWLATSGGTYEQWVESNGNPPSWTNTPGDQLGYWGSGNWPELGYGYLVVEGGTNNDWPPPFEDSAEGLNYGHYNFRSYDGLVTINNNDQGQLALITGGEPGVTGSELYLLSGDAPINSFEYQNWFSDGWTSPGWIPPEQIQIGSLGSLTNPSTNIFGTVYGTLWALLPQHTQVPVTPNASGSQYVSANVSAQGYQLISQCVATTPVNTARTTIGVGEQVNLFFNPTLPTNARWSASAGSVSVANGVSTQFTAPSNAQNATVTATVSGKSVSVSFHVLAPSGVDHAQIIATNHYAIGAAGAGMQTTIWVAPTNVSFYRVNCMEVGEDASDISGYFTQWTPQQLHHSTADFWFQLNAANCFEDTAAASSLLQPWSTGGFTWNIPAKWQVIGSGVTNSMSGWNQVVSIDASGTVSVQKFGHSVTRTTNDVITTQ